MTWLQITGIFLTAIAGPLLAVWIKNWVQKQVDNSKAEQQRKDEQEKAAQQSQSTGDKTRDTNASIDAQAKARKAWEDANL